MERGISGGIKSHAQKIWHKITFKEQLDEAKAVLAKFEGKKRLKLKEEQEKKQAIGVTRRVLLKRGLVLGAGGLMLDAIGRGPISTKVREEVEKLLRPTEVKAFVDIGNEIYEEQLHLNNPTKENAIRFLNEFLQNWLLH